MIKKSDLQTLLGAISHVASSTKADASELNFIRSFVYSDKMHIFNEGRKRCKNIILLNLLDINTAFKLKYNQSYICFPI